MSSSTLGIKRTNLSINKTQRGTPVNVSLVKLFYIAKKGI